MTKNLSRGFTLIELLVVVAILGVLAVGVVTLLNPAEKNNIAKDTANKNVAAEITGAFDRYFLDGSLLTADTYTGATFTGLIDDMVDWGYLKSGISRSVLYNDANTELTKTDASDEVEICFDVKSKQYQTGITPDEGVYLYCQ